jgi:hypothetical protein
MRQGKGSRIAALGLALAALVAATSCAGAKWREVDALLAAAAEPVRGEGFTPMSGPYNDFGSFRGVLTQPWTVTLDSGIAYAVAIACSEACEAMTLAVESPDGTTQTRDSTPDGRASLVRLTAPAGGGHTVRITGQCAVGARCWWASQVYTRSGRGLRPGFAGGQR